MTTIDEQISAWEYMEDVLKEAKAKASNNYITGSWFEHGDYDSVKPRSAFDDMLDSCKQKLDSLYATKFRQERKRG